MIFYIPHSQDVYTFQNTNTTLNILIKVAKIVKKSLG